MSLLKQIESENTDKDQMSIYFLGQSGYVLKCKELTIYIDPYLTDYIENPLGLNEKKMHRSFPSPIDPESISKCDAIICTHSHADHMDPWTINKIDVPQKKDTTFNTEWVKELTLLLPCKNMNPLSAIDVQRRYLDVALKEISGCDEETDWILCEWGNVLNLLVNDRTALVGSLDWVTKYWLLETFIESEKIDWTDPWLVSLDLEYHNIDPKHGLFLSLENTGNTRRICTDDQIHVAMNSGPLDTRAGIRGLCVSKFSDEVEAVQWERIFFKGGGASKNVLEMGTLFDLNDIKKLRAAIMETSNPSVLCDY